MQYRRAIKTSAPETLGGRIQPGQWIDYEGAKGRFMGWRRGVIWIAWGATARNPWRFRSFSQAYARSLNPLNPQIAQGEAA